MKFSRYNATNWYEWNEIIINGKFAEFLRSNAKESESKAIQKMRTMYKACMSIGLSTRTENQTMTIIAEYLTKLDIPFCPNGIGAKNNTTDSSMNKRGWVKTIANVKRLIGLDSIIGFDILPDPTNRHHHHVFFGARRAFTLL